MIGSRWFKVMLVLMCLFVARMAWRATMMQADDKLNTALTAGDLFTAFQNDRDEVVDTYGGKRINIEGQVCEILGNQRPSGVTLVGFRNSCADQKMIQCLLWAKRSYRQDDFAPTQEIVMRCHFPDDQDDPWINLDYCKVLYSN